MFLTENKAHHSKNANYEAISAFICYCFVESRAGHRHRNKSVKSTGDAVGVVVQETDFRDLASSLRRSC